MPNVLEYIGNEQHRTFRVNNRTYVAGTLPKNKYIRPVYDEDEAKLLRKTYMTRQQFQIAPDQSVLDEEIVDEPDGLNLNDMVVQSEPAEAFDFTQIKGIGEAKANRIREAGFNTIEDVVRNEDGFISQFSEEVYANVLNYANSQTES